MAKKDQIEQEESLSDEDKAKHMKNLIEGICYYIRFPMMTVSELASIPLKAITNYHKEFFCERMAIGMSFHANQPHNQDTDELNYTPRLYTADIFCLEMKVEEIHNVENYKNFPACFFSLSEFPHNNDISDGNLMRRKFIRIAIISMTSQYFFFQRTQFNGKLISIHEESCSTEHKSSTFIEVNYQVKEVITLNPKH